MDFKHALHNFAKEVLTKIRPIATENESAPSGIIKCVKGSRVRTRFLRENKVDKNIKKKRGKFKKNTCRMRKNVIKYFL